MNRACKNRRGGPMGQKIPSPKGSVPKPQAKDGRANMGAGSYVGGKPKADWDGPGRVVKQGD